MADFEQLLTSFSSDMGPEQLLDEFDSSSPLFGLDTLGGAELNAMPITSGPTVSPQELALQDSPSLYGSAPPSGAYTNLTSPDMYSPAYGVDHIEQNWPSLFPGSEPDTPSSIQRTLSNDSIDSTSPSGSPSVQMAGGRPKAGHRHSNSGISKPRRKPGPLKDIVVDPSDKVAAKRARNTLAARDSRARKAQHVDLLEAELAEARAEIEMLRTQLANARSGHVN